MYFSLFAFFITTAIVIGDEALNVVKEPLLSSVKDAKQSPIFNEDWADDVVRRVEYPAKGEVPFSPMEEKEAFRTLVNKRFYDQAILFMRLVTPTADLHRPAIKKIIEEIEDICAQGRLPRSTAVYFVFEYILHRDPTLLNTFTAYDGPTRHDNILT
jgi:hypothetical protein